jgi:hypothetical protein
LSGVNPLLASGVQLAADWGVVDPDRLNPAEEATRGQAASVLARLVRATRTGLPQDSTLASDAPQGAAGADQALLAALGISDTPPGAAYGFDTPLTAAAYVDLLGKAYEYLARDSSGTPPAASQDLPTAADVQAVTTALTGADAAAAAARVVEPLGDALAFALAPYAGLAPLGLQLAVDPPVARDGAVVSSVTVRGPSGPVAGGDLVWVRVDGTWKVQSPATLTPRS